jgi:hypothetical protein
VHYCWSADVVLCDNLVAAISLALLFRLSGVMSKYCEQ